MILRMIDLYVVDGVIVVGNEYDSDGKCVILSDYVPLNAGVGQCLIVRDDESVMEDI